MCLQPGPRNWTLATARLVLATCHVCMIVLWKWTTVTMRLVPETSSIVGPCNFRKGFKTVHISDLGNGLLLLLRAPPPPPLLPPPLPLLLLNYYCYY